MIQTPEISYQITSTKRHHLDNFEVLDCIRLEWIYGDLIQTDKCPGEWERYNIL